MSITRATLSFDGQFVMVPNSWVRDRRLSRKARGLLAEIMSHAEGWVITMESLSNGGPEGIDAIRSGVLELERLGYLTRSRTRNPDGTMGGVDFILTEPHSNEPTLDYPTLDKPTLAEPTLAERPPKKTISSEDQNQELSPLPGLESVVPAPQLSKAEEVTFDQFWEIWPKKVAKADARKVWLKALKAAGHPDRIITAAQRLRHQVDQKLTEAQYLPNPDRWLRGARWEDNEVKAAPAATGFTPPAARPVYSHSGANVADQLTDAELGRLMENSRLTGRAFTEADVRRTIEERGAKN